MELMFIGADHEVTGSCHYLRVNETNILVDYGMEQGTQTFQSCELPVEPALIHYVFLTHAHIDHSGLLPFLFARGFRGSIYTTDATADLCSIMLRDSAHIQMQEAEWKNRKAKRSSEHAPMEPLYTMEDADGVIRRLVPCDYEKKIEVCPGVVIRFTDIGHLLGSASIEVWATEEDVTRKLVFSGDIGNTGLPLMKNPRMTKEADYVIMESTYGDRNHSEEKVDFVAELSRILQQTFDAGGNVVIPSFAVGRTQEMLYFLREIKEKRLIRGHEGFQVYVDSPLAVQATTIFNKNMYECFDEATLELVKRGVNPISFPGLNLSITSDESKAINFDDEPKVILSASGMCEAGRIRHHLKHNLWREDSTILFVGYQAVGTLGRAIVEGASTVKLFGEEIEIRAKIMKLAGISGHADKEGLISWLQGFQKKPRRVFVVHGEDTVCDRFVECLEDNYGYDARAPYSGGCYDLITNTHLEAGNNIRIERDKKLAKPSSTVYDRLVEVGKRLMRLIDKSRGWANKDLAKLADQLQALCEKWEK